MTGARGSRTVRFVRARERNDVRSQNLKRTLQPLAAGLSISVIFVAVVSIPLEAASKLGLSAGETTGWILVLYGLPSLMSPPRSASRWCRRAAASPLPAAASRPPGGRSSSWIGTGGKRSVLMRSSKVLFPSR